MRSQRKLCILLLLLLPHDSSAGLREGVDYIRAQVQVWRQPHIQANESLTPPINSHVLKDRVRHVRVFCRAGAAKVGDFVSRLSPFKAFAPIFLVYAAENVTPGHTVTSQDQETLDQRFLDEISNGLDEREKGLEPLFDKDPPKRGLTILLGRVSAGKSTIASYESKDELVAVLANGTLIIDRKPGFIPKDSQTNPIVHGYASGTRIPYRRGEWLDFPGLFGTEGPAGKILNAYSITRVLEKAPRVRFLIVVTDAEIDARKGRGESFVQIIKQICATLSESPIDTLKKGVNLVITQGKNLNPEKYKNDIRDILRVRSNEFSEREKELLESIASPENKQITFFPEPDTEGPLPRGIKVIRDDAQYVRGLKATPVLDDRTEKHVKEVAKRITYKVTEQLVMFHKDMGQHTKVFVQTHDGNAQTMRSIFHEQRKSLEAVLSSSIMNAIRQRVSEEKFLDANVTAIKGILQQLSPSLAETFMRLIKQRKILLSIKPDSFHIRLCKGVCVSRQKEVALIKEKEQSQCLQIIT